MVAEVAGSTIVMVSAAAAAVIASAAMIQAAGTYDANAVTNMAMHAWDRFGSSNLAWVETTLTYPGGHLEIYGDINLCFVPATAGGKCGMTNLDPVKRCSDPTLKNKRHGCWDAKQAGSAIQVRYEGAVDVGFDAGRGDPLGYVVSGPRHTGSGVVGVR